MSDCHGCSSAAALYAPPAPNGSGSRHHTVALVGPPNSGKSTLFNRLTGLRQKVANFPGVTVEQHTGRAKVANQEVTLIDLPGIYSLSPRSEDERVTHDVLTGQMPGIDSPNAVLLILDSTNLQRHLVLAAPILKLGLPTLVVLNMADDLHSRGGQVDASALARDLGAPVAMISAAKGDGVEKVFQFLEGSAVASHSPKPLVQLPVLQDVPKCRQWAAQIGSKAAYQAPVPSAWTRRLDAVFLHPVWGPIIFAVVVMAVFQTIFTGAKPAMELIETLIETRDRYIGSLLPEGLLKSLIIDGVWNGVGSVVVFLPQILLLFLFIGILEDSGYLARAALIADRTMRRVGLQGKIVHSSAFGLRLRCAGNHVDPDDREQARSHCHDTDCAVHDMLGPIARLRSLDSRIFARSAGPRPLARHSGSCASRTLRSRISGGLRDSARAQILRSEKRAQRLRSRDAAVSASNAPLAGIAAVMTAPKCSCAAPEPLSWRSPLSSGPRESSDA